MASPTSHHSHDPRAPKPDESFDEYAERQRAAVPPVLYLPVTGGGGNVAHEIEMRPTKDGRMALLAYTALDRLEQCCGPHQPWVLAETHRLDELTQSGGGFDVLYLDLAIPEDQRHGPAESSRS